MDVLYFSYSKCQSEILVLSNIPVLNHRSIALLSELYLWQAWFRVHHDSSEFINTSLYIPQCLRSLPGAGKDSPAATYSCKNSSGYDAIGRKL